MMNELEMAAEAIKGWNRALDGAAQAAREATGGKCWTSVGDGRLYITADNVEICRAGYNAAAAYLKSTHSDRKFKKVKHNGYTFWRTVPTGGLRQGDVRAAIEGRCDVALNAVLWGFGGLR